MIALGESPFCGKVESWIESYSQVLEGDDASRNKEGKEGSIAGNHSKVRTPGPKSMGSQIRGKNARRNPKTGAVRPQRRLGTDKGYLQIQKGGKRYILLSSRSLGAAGSSSTKPEERHFVIDSGASVQKLS